MSSSNMLTNTPRAKSIEWTRLVLLPVVGGEEENFGIGLVSLPDSKFLYIVCKADREES